MQHRWSMLCLTLAWLAAGAVLGLGPGAVPALAGPQGKFYVIGTGPAGPQTATLQALETIKRMDAILAPQRQAQIYAQYIGKVPVIMDPWQGIWSYKGKPYSKLTLRELDEFRVERFRVRDERVKKIKQLMAQGQNVALLDWGNPCLFGPSHWYVEKFKPEEVVIIPGMGCDAAAMAALGRSTIPAHSTRFLVQTAPFFLFNRAPNPGMGFDAESEAGLQAMRDLAKHEHTLIIYMGLKDPVKLFKTLGRFLPADLPAACVFYAGYPGKERVVRGTVADLGAKLAADKERFMGLLFVGRFLSGTPYEDAMHRHMKPARAKP